MKSLSSVSPMIVMMVGIPGSGKSHFARQFAEVFQTPLVSYDKTQYLLFAEPQFSKDEELIIASIMNSQIKELLKTQKSFIIDGALNSKAARMEVSRLAKRHDYGLLTVWVQTDNESAKTRATKRSKRRDGDKFNHSLSADQFAGYAKRINPPDLKENHVVISGKHTFASQAKAVLKKIVSPRTTSLQSEARPLQTSLSPRPASSKRTPIVS